MKYEIPEVTLLTPAINAVQSTLNKMDPHYQETIDTFETVAPAYLDWE
jgi:hypothetical protein